MHLINNRQGQGQAGRRRGRGGQRPQGGGGGGGGGANRDTGNRIDSRARGNAAQLLEKYKSLARDAQMQGDRVNTEYFLQFADHYFRVLSETRSRFEENRPQRNDGANTFDEDFEDAEFDGEAQAPAPREFAREQQPPRDDYRRDEPRRNEPRREANGNRDPNRDQAPREQAGRERFVRDQDAPEQGSRDGNREQRDRNPADNRGDRVRRPDAQPVLLEPRAPQVEESAPAAVEAAEPAPRRRGRPRRDAAVESAPVPDAATVQDAAMQDAAPAGLDADRLPPALGIGSDDGAERPRRRRGRPPASEGGVTAA